ncbi:MAG: terminase large subunit domain-containing protein [Hyphomicrobiales bacterium]
MGLKQLSNEIHPDTEIVWRPNPGSQTKFVRSPFWETLYDGTRGPGKTDALLMKFAQHVGKGHGRAWRGIIFRKRYKNLDEIKVKGKRFFFPAFAGCRFLEAKSDYKFVWPSGEELLLRALEKDDDYWDYHGHEYPFVGFDELTTWPTDYLYEAMKSCSRTSVPGIPRFYCATTNPYGPGHGWVKSYWYDPAPAYDPTGVIIRNPKNGELRARYTGDLLENKQLIEASPEYVQQLDSIGNEALRLAWRFGNWDIMVGGFWDGVWNHDLHIIEPFTPPVTWRHWRAMDWGYAHPYSVGWYAKSPEGQVIRYRELYGWGGKEDVGSRENASVVARRILALDAFERKYGTKFQMNPADDQIWQGHGTERKIVDSFTDAGVIWMKAKKGKDSRVNGANAVREALEARIPIGRDGGELAGASARARELGEKPGFAVTRSCRHFLRTFPILMPDEDDWEDVDTEQEDHCFAAETEIIATDTHVYSLGRWRRYRNARLTRRNAVLLRLRFSDGSEVKCTPTHKFWTGLTWVEARHLSQRVLLSSPPPGRISAAFVTTFAAITSCARGAAKDTGAVLATRRSRFMRIAPSIAAGGAKPLRCVAVEECGRADVYCLTVPSVGAFTLPNGITVANCYDEVRYSLFSRHSVFRRKQPGHDSVREKELPRPRIAGDPVPSRRP